MAEIYAALAYYEDHREEIVAQAAADVEFAQRFKAQHPDFVRDPQSEETAT